ncbi:MAG TPA: hypothetical protein DCS82_08440 [Rhodospirillaceae bacterium]|nr:hypothetical protein [Rhodospirillaceae bacterium]HAT35730.1 hypothetical protein [Rhodospirillaceae bacterium]
MHQSFSKGDYVWVLPVPAQRWLWKPLALHVAEKTRLKPILIVSSEQDRQFYHRQFGLDFDLESIVLMPEYLDRVVDGKRRPAESLLARATAFEDEHGTTLAREMVQSCRHHGRGFTFGWNGLPRSRAGDASDQLAAIDACVESIDYFENLAEKFPPALVISAGTTGISTKPIPLLCRARDIPMRCLAQGRVNELFYWATDEYENAPDFEEAIASAADPSSAEIDLVETELKANAAFRVFGPQMLQFHSPIHTLKEIAYQLLHHAYMRIRGYRKAKFGFTGRSTAWMLFRKFLATRKFTKPPYFSLEDLPSDRKIVFFPLGNEPEASVQGQSPEFSNQYAMLCEMALSLPADAILAVKEHPIQLGRRNDEFYRRIDAMPNTVMMQAHQPSHEIIKKSAMVCTINGSAAYEAAMFGKPVAYFSHHGPIRAVPHVKSIRGFEDLAWIRETLATDTPDAVARRRQDGARFYLAAKHHCMDLEPLDFHNRTDAPNEQEIDLIAQPLFASLQETQTQSAQYSEPANAIL